MESTSPTAADMLRDRIVVTDRCAKDKTSVVVVVKMKKMSTTVAAVALGEVAVGNPWRRTSNFDLEFWDEERGTSNEKLET